MNHDQVESPSVEPANIEPLVVELHKDDIPGTPLSELLESHI